MDRLGAYWHGLWGAPAPPAQPLIPWLEALAAVPSMPRPAPLIGQELREVVDATSKGKAAGADGWTYEHMAAWPPEVFEVLAAWLGLVERQGRWPADWAPNTVCLLPKGGARAVGDRRPIVLLSCVYRAWAAAPAPVAPRARRPALAHSWSG